MKRSYEKPTLTKSPAKLQAVAAQYYSLIMVLPQP